MLATIVAADGCAGHPHVAHLMTPQVPLRDLVDAIHAFCAVHGRHPGMIDEAHDHCAQPDARGWLAAAGAGFVVERGALVHLIAAAGPLPSTPGQSETEAALTHVRHTVSILARSDRAGCATGAAVAFVEDWGVVRDVMQRAASALGVDIAPVTLPVGGQTAAALEGLDLTQGTMRAMAFGARQILSQQRGLWDLLAARARARGR